MSERCIAGSTVTKYVAVERRQGLAAMGQRLLRGIQPSVHKMDYPYPIIDVKLGAISTSWHKGFSDEHNLIVGQGQRVVAISAFHLSEAKSDIERKDLVKQMWNSGADTIVSSITILPLCSHSPHGQVLIDHGTKTGFSHVIEAREYLLTLGNREAIEGSAVPGAHVLAPVGIFVVFSGFQI